MLRKTLEREMTALCILTDFKMMTWQAANNYAGSRHSFAGSAFVLLKFDL